MNVIFEGLDRCGKTSLIKAVQPMLFDKPMHVLHYSNFRGLKDKGDYISYSIEVYSQMFEFINDKRFNVVCDRGHLGEYVWGGKYRGYSDIERKYVFNLEKAIKDQDDVVMFVLVDSFLKCFDRDDGMSLHKSKEECLEIMNAFKEAYELSNIKHKYLVDIAGRSLEDVKNLVTSILASIMVENNEKHV